jgi:hypothetical protein
MPRKQLMSPTFKGRHARWRKDYKGTTYTVNCSDLGLPEDQWTELGSYQAANQWWIARKAEIDGRKGKKAVPPHVEAILSSLKQKLEYRRLWRLLGDTGRTVYDEVRRQFNLDHDPLKLFFLLRVTRDGRFAGLPHAKA